MMKHGLQGLVIVAGALALAACSEEAEVPVEAAGDCPPGVNVTEGWLSLPAVAENPGAAYFTIANDAEEQITLRTVDVLGADSAELHQTATYNFQTTMNELFAVAVMPGEAVVFEPGGRHVMAMGIREGVAAGSETEVTLTFAGGDKCSFPVTTYPAGELPEGFEPSAESDGAETDNAG